MSEKKATGEDINRWFVLQEELAQLKVLEMELRQKICATFFPDPKEGTNNLPLKDKWVLKMGHTINRTLDEGEFDARRKTLIKHGIPADDLVIQVPKFVLPVYRALTDEQRNEFDLCLTIKPGAPSLSLVQSKR